MIRKRAVLAMGSALAAMVTMAACGAATRGSTDTTSAGGGASSVPSGVAKSHAAASGAMPTTNMLMARRTRALGTIVTDHRGYTLYRYGKDMKGMSMCTGACTRKWPPLMAEGIPQAQGVSRAFIGTITRSDGMKQLTLAGWPLYRHTADIKPSMWHGQGMDGAWAAVTPTGKMDMKGMNMGG